MDALAADGDFVQYSGPVQPAYKLGPSIEQRILEQSDPNQLVPVVIQIYDHPGKKASQQVIASLAAEVVSDWSPILAFENTPRSLLDQTHIFGATGETWVWNGAVADPSKPVRIVLNYTDAAGAIGTSPQVNNLNLTAVVGVSTYLGNRFSGQLSITGVSADSANNYEAVFLPAGTSGALQITVAAANIAGNGIPTNADPTDQDFALVCYNCAPNPDFPQVVTPYSLNVCAPANAVYTVNVGSILGFTNPVTLSASGNPAGSTANFSPNPVTPPGASTFTVGSTGAAAAGSYTINVDGTASGGTP